MTDQDISVISDDYYLSNCINFERETYNVYIKKKWTQDRDLRSPMLGNFQFELKLCVLEDLNTILCFLFTK